MADEGLVTALVVGSCPARNHSQTWHAVKASATAMAGWGPHQGCRGRHVGSYIGRCFSLCMFCVECPRVIEWTPPELAYPSARVERHCDRRLFSYLAKMIAGWFSFQASVRCELLHQKIGQHFYAFRLRLPRRCYPVDRPSGRDQSGNNLSSWLTLRARAK